MNEVVQDPKNVEKITVDGEEFVVADLPEGIQGAVQKYNQWRQKAVDAQDDLNLVSAALRDLGANIVTAIREVKSADAETAAEAAADEAAITDADVEAAVAEAAALAAPKAAPKKKAAKKKSKKKGK